MLPLSFARVTGSERQRRHDLGPALLAPGDRQTAVEQLDPLAHAAQAEAAALASRLEALAVVAHRGLEPELVEGGRPQLRDQPAELLHLLRDVLLRLPDPLEEALGRSRPADRRQQHVEAGKALERLVVKLARPARALGLGRLEALPRRPLARLGQRRLHALALALVGEHDHGAGAARSRHRAAAEVDGEARAVAPPEAIASERLAARRGPGPVDRAVLARVGTAVRPGVV